MGDAGVLRKVGFTKRSTGLSATFFPRSVRMGRHYCDSVGIDNSQFCGHVSQPRFYRCKDCIRSGESATSGGLVVGCHLFRREVDNSEIVTLFLGLTGVTLIVYPAYSGPLDMELTEDCSQF